MTSSNWPRTTCCSPRLGFTIPPGGERWSADRRSRTVTKAQVEHIAMTGDPAYLGAQVLAVRSAFGATGILESVGDDTRAPTPNLDRILPGAHGRRCRAVVAMTDWLTRSGGPAVWEMTPGVLDLRLYRGDSFATDLNFTNADDEPEPYPLTGIWRAQIRAHAEGPTVLDTFTVDTTRQDVGIINISLTTAQTLALPDRSVWDLENTPDDGKIRTYLMGSLFASGDVTR